MSELPPLPEPIFGRLTVDSDDGYWYECDAPAGEPAFDADQMHAYARAAVAAEREACARLCQLESAVLSTRDQTRGALYCADKIRARATMETHAPSTR